MKNKFGKLKAKMTIFLECLKFIFFMQNSQNLQIAKGTPK